MKKFTSATLMLVACLGIGCEKSSRSFSILADDQVFQQSPTVIERKIDILWVVDNSGSMESSQANLASSFQSFITRFQSLNYDFHMAVTTSDAYRAEYNNNTDLLLLRDGSSVSGSSGVRVMKNDTPNLSSVFITNITQGINGSGDERAFQSLKNVLSYSENADFRRNDAFLAIIIVSDEDDFSATTSAFLNGNYNSIRLVPVDTYFNFLKDLTQSGLTEGSPLNFSVSAITIPDDACLAQLTTDEWPGRSKGIRYLDLVAKSAGVTTSLCGNFGDALELISDSIIALTTVFHIEREPIPESIKVIVDGVSIPQDAATGWIYQASDKTIRFPGSFVPGQGSAISITYDPIAPEL